MTLCPKCKDHIYKIKVPGTIIWNAKIKHIGHTFLCSKCNFEGRPSFSYYLALFFYKIGFSNPYKGQVRATRPDWGYNHD